jgi:hypothetical protein
VTGGKGWNLDPSLLGGLRHDSHLL